jgi:hypothetical protein
MSHVSQGLFQRRPYLALHGGHAEGILKRDQGERLKGHVYISF